jgi:caa(3)-type oxidase subunit IV
MKTYVIAGIALLLLTALSFSLSRLPLGVAEMPVAYGIAAIKVTLVGLVFMHLRHGGAGERLFALAGIVMITILIGIAATDVYARHPTLVP